MEMEIKNRLKSFLNRCFILVKKDKKKLDQNGYFHCGFILQILFVLLLFAYTIPITLNLMMRKGQVDMKNTFDGIESIPILFMENSPARCGLMRPIVGLLIWWIWG